MAKILFMNASPNKDGATNRIAEKLLKNKEYAKMQMSDYEVSQYGAVRNNDQIKEMLNIIKDYDTVVREEQNNDSSNSLREYKSLKKDLSTYDEIILGTPVWWYTIAPVIRTFLTKYDLTGKTIKPFATNAGWLGHTFQEIQKLCPNSKVEKGMNIVFTDDYTENQLVTTLDEIDEWIDEL